MTERLSDTDIQAALELCEKPDEEVYFTRLRLGREILPKALKELQELRFKFEESASFISLDAERALVAEAKVARLEEELEDERRVLIDCDEDYHRLDAELDLAKERLGPAGYKMLEELKHLREYVTKLESDRISVASCCAENEARLEKALSALRFYADKKNYSLDYDTSNLVSRRVILYGDQEEINDSTMFAGLRARQALKEIGGE